MRKNILKQLRESQSFLSYLKEWMPLAFFVGISAGLVMMAFYFSISALKYIFAAIPVYYSMIAGGLVTALFLGIGIKKVQGSGVQHYIGCRRGTDHIGLKDAGYKFLASSAAIGSGCIAGKEGPAIFLGGGIALFWARLLKFPNHKRNLTVTLGGAAATSAIFQTPLGGTIFAAEVPFRHDIDAPEYMPAFLSSLIAYFIFRYGTFLISGESPRILDLHISNSLNTPQYFMNSFLVGIAAGLVGVFFVKIFHFARTKIAPRFRPEISALIGVGISAVISFLVLNTMMHDVPFGGTGFRILNYIESNSHLSVNFFVILLFATVIACSLTVGMNVSGGVFGPALVVGGSTGGIAGFILDPANISAYMVIGMSAVHTATTKTPIASLVLIMEMTGYPSIFLAMAIANVAAFFVSGDNCLYHSQMRGRFEEFVQQLRELDVLSRLQVKDIMEMDVLFLFEHEPVSDARKIFSDTGEYILPIIDRDNILLGTLTMGDVRNADDDAPVKDVMKKTSLMLSPDESLEAALYQFYDHNVERAPVVREEGKLIGFLTLRDIIGTYRKHVAR
jgi:CIC family chloride channel protein